MKRPAVLAALVAVAGCRLVLSIEDKSSPDSPAAVGDAGAVTSAIDASTADVDASFTDAGLCKDGLTYCFDRCVALAVEPLHCGRCGRSCGTGPCTAGRCDVTLVAQAQDVTAIDQNKALIFWIKGVPGRVRRISKDNNVASTIIAQTNGAADGLAVDGPEVYFTSGADGILGHVDIGGAARFDLASGEPGLGPVTLDGTYVYDAHTGPTGAIERVARDGGTAPVIIVPNVASPTALAVDNAYIYWIASATPGAGLWRAAKDGSGAERLETGTFRGIAQNTSALFTFDTTGRRLLRIDKTTRAVIELLGDHDVTAIAADEAAVYLTSQVESFVGRIATSGGVLQVLAIGQAGVGPILVDDQRVFFGTSVGIASTPK